MSAKDPFGGGPCHLDPYPRNFPVSSQKKITCTDTDGYARLIRMVNKIYKDLKDPELGANLVGYNAQYTVRQALDEIFNNPGNLPPELLEEIRNKVDKIEGKGLSTEDFTTELKEKLEGIIAEPSYVAAHTMSGHRVLYINEEGKVEYAEPDDYLKVRKIIGLSLGSATTDSLVKVKREGTIMEAGWSFTEGDVWLGTNGTLTQTLPLSGYLFQVGVALSPIELKLDLNLIAQLT